MTKHIFLVLLVLLTLGLRGGDQSLKVASIFYPDVICISENIKKDITNHKILVKYSYYGPDIIPDTDIWGKFQCTRDYEADMMIFYVTNKSRLLPEAYNFFMEKNNIHALFCAEIIQSDIGSKVFKNDNSNDFEMYLFDGFITLRETEKDELLQAIRAKEISEVVIAINEVKIMWELRYPIGHPKIKEKNLKGQFLLPVNRIIRIHVDYFND